MKIIYFELSLCQSLNIILSSFVPLSQFIPQAENNFFNSWQPWLEGSDLNGNLSLPTWKLILKTHQIVDDIFKLFNLFLLSKFYVFELSAVIVHGSKFVLQLTVFKFILPISRLVLFIHQLCLFLFIFYISSFLFIVFMLIIYFSL